MKIATSRLTSQGQITVPAEIRRRLGLGPGSVLEWEVEDDRAVVRRAGRYSSQDIRRALFPHGPPRRRSIEEIDAGIAEHIRRKHARR